MAKNVAKCLGQYFYVFILGRIGHAKRGQAVLLFGTMQC